MSIKEILIKLKTKLTRREKIIKSNISLSEAIDIQAKNKSLEEFQIKGFESDKSIYLNDKVDDYIKWNFKNMVKGKYTDIGEYWVPIELRNFIEKMAVWYELRYPDYEINRLMPGSSQEGIEINEVMFNSNKYIDDLFDKDSDVRAIDWDEFYNTHAFIKSLPWEERYRFQRAKYKELVYIDPSFTSHGPELNSLGLIKISSERAHLHLTPNGFVELAEEIDSYTDYKVTNEELKEMHVKEVVKLLKERGITLPSDNELEIAIDRVEKFIKEKEGLLDAVMYRIIERGGNRFGPRRGFLFAKEFKRNIDIPMMYGVDRTDPGLRLFINEYIKAGGSKDLMCHVGYFSRTNKMQKLSTISIGDLILKQRSNAASFYTPEETDLHQKIINVLASQINEEEVKNEKVKQLRLQRKLEKSKKTTLILGGFESCSKK